MSERRDARRRIDPRTYYVGKGILITGAGSGLGRALVLEAGRRGAKVYAGDIDPAAAEETCRLLREEKSDALCASLRLDVTDTDDFERALAEGAEKTGGIDILINNAGHCVVGESAAVPLDRWGRIIDVNLKGTAYGTVSAYKKMISRGRGHIINISSLSGKLAYPVTLAYAATKAGIDALSEGLAAEARHSGVRITLVRLGTVDTPAYRTQEVWGMSNADFTATLPGKMLPARRAARIILDGAAKGKRCITAPVSSAAALFLIRWIPGAAGLIRNRSIRKFRSRSVPREGER
jgi:NAD(P)-dependent dehydrogenase (short-subunit alcohol dehydrogenase family)